MEDRAFRADHISDFRKPLLRLATLPLLGIAVLPAPTFAQAEALLPEIDVSASVEPAELRRHASAAKIVFGREDIEALDASSVGELLRKLPGTGLIPDTEGKRGRGKGADKMMPLLLVDGEPLPGGERNPATTLRLSPELIERIEVIRNGGAEYPAAGPGGIINLVLRDVPPMPTLSLRAGIGAQQGAALARLDGQYGERGARFGWLLAGAAHSRPLDERDETEVQRYTAGVRTAWTTEAERESGRETGATLTPRFTLALPGGTHLVLSPFLAANRERRDATGTRYAYADPLAGTGLALAGAAYDTERKQRDSARLVAEWRAVGAAAAPWSELSLKLLAQIETEAKRQEQREFNAGGAQTAARDQRETREEGEAGLVFRGKRLLGAAHLVGIGAELRVKHGDERRELVIDGVAQAPGADAAMRQRERRAVLWAQDEWQAGETWLLTPGLRLQSQSSRIIDGLGAVQERSTSSADPSLHALWQPDAVWNLRASALRHQRAPGLKDLSGVLRAASGDNSSSNPDKAGNPQLRPETSLSLEAGVEHFLPQRAGNMGLSLFRRHIENHIQKLTRLDAGRWVERPQNVGTAQLSGITFDFKARLDGFDLPQLTLRGNLARIQTRVIDPVAALGAGEGPRSSLNLGLDYEIPGERLTLGANFNATSAIDRESSATLRQTQGARRQFDLYARKKLDRNLALRLSLSNLGHPQRLGEVEERDAAGLLARQESERDSSATTLLLALEGRW